MTPKAQSITEKIKNWLSWILLKVKTFALQNTIQRMKRQVVEKEKLLSNHIWRVAQKKSSGKKIHFILIFVCFIFWGGGFPGGASGKEFAC